MRPGPGATWWLLAAAALVALLLVVGTVDHDRRRGAVVLSVGAGLGFGGVGVAARLLEVPSSAWQLATDGVAWALVAHAVLATVAYGLALARGRVTTVAALTFATETVVPALLGVLLLGDRVVPGQGPAGGRWPSSPRSAAASPWRVAPSPRARARPDPGDDARRPGLHVPDVVPAAADLRSPTPQALHLGLDLFLGRRIDDVGVHGVRHDADAPAGDREDRPEEACSRHGPDQDEHPVDEHVDEQMDAEVGLLLEPAERSAAQIDLR